MDMSDDDQSISSLPYKKSRWEQDHKDHAADSERGLADAATESSTVQEGELKMKILHIEVLQETIRNLQTQLLENKAKETKRQGRICELEDELKDANVKQLLLKTKIATTKAAASSVASISSSSKGGDSESEESQVNAPEASATLASQTVPTATKATATIETSLDVHATNAAPDVRQAKILAFASTFLMIHPLGASLDQIWSYVGRYVSEMKPKELEDTFVRYRQLFDRVSGTNGDKEENEEASGINSSPCYRFIGHESNATSR